MTRIDARASDDETSKYRAFVNITISAYNAIDSYPKRIVVMTVTLTMVKMILTVLRRATMIVMRLYQEDGYHDNGNDESGDEDNSGDKDIDGGTDNITHNCRDFSDNSVEDEKEEEKEPAGI